MRIVFLIIILFAAALLIGNELKIDKEMFHGYLDVSAFYSLWDPSLQSLHEDEDDFIDSKTLGEASLTVKGLLEYERYSILKFSYILPLSKKSEMKEIIEYNTEKEQGIENLKFYFLFDPIASRIFPGKKWKYFRWLTNIKYKYQRKRYITAAENISGFYYVPLDAEYNYQTGHIAGMELINPETQMVWNTEIIEQDISIKILETIWDKVVRVEYNGEHIHLLNPIQLRLGYFTVKQSQPCKGIITYNGIPSILETEFVTDGISVSLVTINEQDPGFNMDWVFKMFSNTINNTEFNSASFDEFKEEFEPDAYPAFLSFCFNSWYNVWFSERCLATLGMNLEINAFFIYSPREEGSRDEEEESGDEMLWRLRQYPTDFYFRFSYRF